MSKRDKFRNSKPSHSQSVQPPAVENGISDAPAEETVAGEKVSFFTRFPGKITEFRQKTWSWCRFTAQWVWSGLWTIPAYFASHRKSEEKTETTDEPKPLRSAAPVEIIPADTIDCGEDDVLGFQWWNLGIKAASIAAAALILTGGYFGVQAFLKTPADTGDAKIIALTEQTEMEDGKQQTADDSGVAAAVPTPIPVTVPATVRAMQPQPVPQPTPETEPTPPPVPSLSDQADSFVPLAVASVTAETAPPISSDPFESPATVATVPPASEEPAAAEAVPAITVTPSELPTELTALKPLQALEPGRISTQSQLQPLLALGESLPAPAAASANPPVASNYTPPPQRNRKNPPSSEAPAAPPMNAMPPMTVQRTIPITETIPEVVPRIPQTGTIEHVPPPVVPPTPAPPVKTTNAAEPSPAIPKDAPKTQTSTPIVAVPAAAAAQPSVQADSQPMDWQLWEQIRELRNETEAKPSKLQLGSTPAAAEPALRFTPKNTLPKETTEQFAPLQLPNELSPEHEDIANSLSKFDDVPQPVVADVVPKYREEHAGGEKGVTFQNQINSTIKRSPSATETYVVQRGDTYMTISDKYFGTSLLYTALAAHNQKLGIGWRPTEGVVIEIPTAEFLRMHYGDLSYQQERRLDVQRPAIKYVVQEGDTIFRLATDKLQDSTRWREIYALNAERMQDSRDMRPGMEILLPAL